MFAYAASQCAKRIAAFERGYDTSVRVPVAFCVVPMAVIVVVRMIVRLGSWGRLVVRVMALHHAMLTGDQEI